MASRTPVKETPEVVPAEETPTVTTPSIPVKEEPVVVPAEEPVQQEMPKVVG